MISLQELYNLQSFSIRNNLTENNENKSIFYAFEVYKQQMGMTTISTLSQAFLIITTNMLKMDASKEEETKRKLALNTVMQEEFMLQNQSAEEDINLHYIKFKNYQ